MSYLPSPAGGDLWYHGSPRRFDALDPFAPSYGGSWNAALGFHFSARRDVARGFADGRFYGTHGECEVGVGQVLAARVRANNPLPSRSENDLDFHAIWVAYQQGDERRRRLMAQAAEYSPKAFESAIKRMGPLPDAAACFSAWGEQRRAFSVLTRREFGSFLLWAIVGHEGWRVFFNDRERAETKARERALGESVREDLIARGYDCAFYENDEETFSTASEPCLVVFDVECVEIDSIESIEPQHSGVE